MSDHLRLERWLDDNHAKGESLTPGKEVIVYQIPLAKEFKTRVIAVLDRFRADLGCSLTLRGRARMERQRRALSDSSGQEMDKLHHIYVKVIGTGGSQEQRVQKIRRAEATIDAFFTTMLHTKDADKIYMFPPADTQPPPTETTSTTRRWLAQLTDSGDITGFEAPVAQSPGAPVTGLSHVTPPAHGQEEAETLRDSGFSPPTESLVAEVAAMSQQERLQRAEAARGCLVKTWRDKFKIDGRGRDFRGIISGDCMADIPDLLQAGCVTQIAQKPNVFTNVFTFLD
jgi:hypothetical protein